MSTKKTKKGGAGKFFLGALLGGIAGLVASNQLKNKQPTACPKCTSKTATPKTAVKKPAAKKSATKQAASKTTTKK